MSHDDLVQRALHLLAQQPETGKPKEVPKQQQALDPTIQAGDQITWRRGDGSTQVGVVEARVDVDGRHWAFVTQGNTWAAVNCQFVKVVKV